jgi:hypothetical protein
MRRLARFSRPLNAIFALWFAMVLGDPGVLHSCPMHGGHGAVGAAAAAAPAGHEGHSAHGSTSASSSAETGQHRGTPAPCTCVGHCCAAPVVAPLPTVTSLHVPAAVAEVRHPLAVPSRDVPASPDTRLPFANGPPSA